MGASKGNLGLAGFGCVSRDHDHNVIRALCRPFEVCDAITAKTTSLLMGLRKLNQLRLQGCEVEGDSTVVISWGNIGDFGSWNLTSILYEIWELMSLFCISLSNVDRSQNELANKLAN